MPLDPSSPEPAEPPDRAAGPRQTWTLDTRHVGRCVLVFDEVESTNDVAAGFAADPTAAGLAVIAGQQTRGRGQHGRVWQSRPGSSLLMSVLVFPPPALNRPVLLTAWAAVAVARAVRSAAGRDARIKWPNDLLVGGKKVCGILIEQRGGTVVGLGLNLNQTDAEFATAGLPDAGSLGGLTGQTFDAAAVGRDVLRELDAGYESLLGGGRAAVEAEWVERIGLVGVPVVAESADGSFVGGRLRGMGFDGIELEVGDGGVRRLTPEGVRQLRGCDRSASRRGYAAD